MPDEATTRRDATGRVVPILADVVTNRNGQVVPAVAPDQSEDPRARVQLMKVVEGADGHAADVIFSELVALIVDAVQANATSVVGAGAGDVVSTLTDGRQTVDAPGIAEALRTSLACKWVMVTALKGNTNTVAVGGAAVKAGAPSTGTPLGSGESVTIPVNDAAKVFVDALTAGEGVSFTVGI
jgi:hypothetical protein